MSETKWAFSDGSGRLFINDDVKELTKDGTLLPFYIHKYIQSINTIVISTSIIEETTKFDLMAINLDETTESLNHGIMWRLRSDDFPSLVEYVANEWCLASSSAFTRVDNDGGDLITEEEPAQSITTEEPRTTQNQCTWSQDQDTVSIVVHLTEIGNKDSYAPVIKTKEIKLPSLHDEILPLSDEIDIEASNWILNRQLSQLEIDLGKKNQTTRWISLFDEHFKPPFEITDERLSDEHLQSALSSLEKYTEEGDGTQSPKIRPGSLSDDIPSLAKGEMDDNVDSDVGRLFKLTKFSNVDELQHFTSQRLLSTPLPSYPKQDHTFIISDETTLAGALFETTSVQNLDSFAALPFVIASKRDLKFTHHLSNELVIVFEGGNHKGAGNAFIYFQTESDQSDTAPQSVFQFCGYEKGSLLGVAYFKSQGILVGLCENSLVVISDLI